jgi:hypothetical protein
MSDQQPAVEFRTVGSGRYLVIADGAVIGGVERRVGPGRGYADSKQINYTRTQVWEPFVRDVDGLLLTHEQRYAIEHAIKGRKTTRRHAVRDLLHAWATAGIDLPSSPDDLARGAASERCSTTI